MSESIFGEEALLRLNLLAVRRFPTFAADLEERTGQHIGLRREGTLAVAYDPGDHAALLRLTEFRRSVGLDAAELDAGPSASWSRSSPRRYAAARCSPATGRWTTGATWPRCARRRGPPGCAPCPAW